MRAPYRLSPKEKKACREMYGLSVKDVNQVPLYRPVYEEGNWNPVGKPVKSKFKIYSEHDQSEEIEKKVEKQREQMPSYEEWAEHISKMYETPEPLTLTEKIENLWNKIKIFWYRKIIYKDNPDLFV